MHETHRLSWDGAVDADGHILEPSDLWERYVEPKYRDRALRIVKDENGLDELEIDGKPSMMARRGMPSTLAAMGRLDLGAMARDPEVTYDNHAAFGSQDPKERLQVLDAEHIDAAVIYTTTGLLWEAELAGRRALTGLHPRVQPVDLRVVLGQRRTTRARRSPVARRPRSSSRRIGAGGR